MRNLLVICLLLVAPALCAEEFLLEVEVGIGGTPQAPGLVAGPYTPLVVHIQRTEARPFKGRVVVETVGRSSRGRGRGRGGPFMEEGNRIELSQEVVLEEGVQHAVVRFELPVFGGMIGGLATLEAASGSGFDPVAAREFSSGARADSRALVGFVSQARLADAQPYLFQEMIEIQLQHLPETWKLLACFDVIILNDDRLSTRQAEALVDYVVAGGNLVISPTSAAAFNPDRPIAKLLGLTGGTGQSPARLSEFKNLRDMPKYIGASRSSPMGGGTPGGPAVPPVPVPGPEGEASAIPGAAELPVIPEDTAELLLWSSGGRARPVEEMRRLLSYARAGAGTVALLHVDLSQYPLVTAGARKPTAAGINLLGGALRFSAQAPEAFALSRMSTPDARDTLEIAGKRIPGRDIQVLLIFVYVGAAGVGMFLLARRIRRPEFYPGALLGLALLSVLLVFSLGEVYKRAGARARAARLVVSDGTSGRNAVFTTGCAYVVDEANVDFTQDRAAWLMPGKLGSSIRGLPAEYEAHTSRSTGVETTTSVGDLVRWQNLFFASAEPAAVADLRISLVGDGGNYTLENRSPHRITGCLVLVGGPPASGNMPRCEWHYVAALGPAGSADAKVPLSKATLAPKDGNDIMARLSADAEDNELAAGFLSSILGISENRRVLMPRNLDELERPLEQSNLLPMEGEYLVLALLPPESVSKGSLGLRGLEPDRIDQAVVWAARGLLESR